MHNTNSKVHLKTYPQISSEIKIQRRYANYVEIGKCVCFCRILVLKFSLMGVPDGVVLKSLGLSRRRCQSMHGHWLPLVGSVMIATIVVVVLLPLASFCGCKLEPRQLSEGCLTPPLGVMALWPSHHLSLPKTMSTMKPLFSLVVSPLLL